MAPLCSIQSGNPARTTYEKDVIIRLVVVGDEGQNHIGVLGDVATTLEVAHEGHVIPLTQGINKGRHDDCRLSARVRRRLRLCAISVQWYKRVSEVLDAMEQLLLLR